MTHDDPSALAFMQLVPEFRAASWNGWRQVLARITPAVRELYIVAGRGSGKSRVVALLATWCASRPYRRAPGEQVYIGVFGPDRKQASVTHRYIAGLLRSVPALAALVERETKGSLELRNGITIEVITASVAAPRGRAYALAIVEEAAFLPSDESANPDVELLRAVRPALARVPGSLLAVVSSPYARRGVLWDAWRRHHDQPDGEVVLVQADTRSLNPMFDPRAIERAYAEDPTSAAAEYGAEFRSDVESYVSREAVADCVVPGRREVPPVLDVQYTAFVDPAGGSGGDSFTLAIAHLVPRADQLVTVVDALRERTPPFSPASVVREFAGLLRQYRVREVIGDRYAGEWPREAFKQEGIRYRTAELAKSDLYRDALALLNSGRLELLDDARLIGQITGLERRTARGGRDSIDHAPGGHDDLANVVAGVAVHVSLRRRPKGGVWGEPRQTVTDNGVTWVKGLQGYVRAHPLGDEELARLDAGGEPKKVAWYERERIRGL